MSGNRARGQPRVPTRGSSYRGAPRGSSPARGAPGPVGGMYSSGSVIFNEQIPAQIPSHLSDASHDSLIQAFSSLEVKPKRPLRPGFGTAGQKITLRANFFPLKVPKGPIYEYDIAIKPEPRSKEQRYRLFFLLEQDARGLKPFLSHIAHDCSKRLVSSRKLVQPLEIQLQFYEEGQDIQSDGKTFVVSVTFQRELNMNELNEYVQGRPQYCNFNPLPLISALNLVLQQHASRTSVRVGQNKFFFKQPQSYHLGTQMEAWKGFFTSVRPTFKQLMVNVNTCMTAFVEPGKLSQALMNFNANSRGGMPTIPPNLIKSIRVTTTHLGYKRRYPLKAIGTTSARNTFFDCEEFGGKISVEQFFQRKYNIKLQQPADLPVVDVTPRGKAQPIYLPAELCTIEEGQAFRGKLGDSETANMIKYACNRPSVNAMAITGQGLPAMGLKPAHSLLAAFGIEVSNEMATIPARELIPPRLSYLNNPTLRVNNGAWNILDVKFQRGASVASWWVLVVRDGQSMISGPQDERFMGLIAKFAAKLRNSGMKIAPVAPPNTGMPRLLVSPLLPPVSGDPGRVAALEIVRATIKASLDAKGAASPSFVLVLLSKRDNYIYPGIKRLGDVEFGVNTICMQLSKALGDERKQDQYLSNIALKVNTKLGGVNHLLDANATRWLTKKKTMMVGIDVTHPSPTSQGGSPSIAAVVASVDDSFVQFPASIRIQQSKKEMLDELRDMMVERLKFYEKKNKVFPERIIVFRDGVSEGQFDTVLLEELPQVLESFKRVSTKVIKKVYRPQVAIIICGKRHHARPLPTSAQFADRNGNTRPGTVIDKGITGVFDFDFYLQAHAGLQGTVRPTHYTVVYDEFGLGADEIQQGANSTSYLYARATKAVSLIPPAYYADLACERGRCYLNEFMSGDRSAAGSTSGRRLSKEEEEKKVFDAAKKAWGEGLHPDMRGTMFYI